jgi:uncharacterized protein YoxC
MRGILLIGVLIAIAIVGYLNLKVSSEHLEPTVDGVRNTAEEVGQEVERITGERMERLRDLDR